MSLQKEVNLKAGSYLHKLPITLYILVKAFSSSHPDKSNDGIVSGAEGWQIPADCCKFNYKSDFK